MRTRPSYRAVTALVATMLLVAPASAMAQLVDPPPTRDELEPGKPWSYQMMTALLYLAVLTTVAVAIGYIAKARAFGANQRRGGSK